ncbi:NADAR family protein [Pseudobdellovibrio exovorus]|uniref:Uncharacterized protein n=1 Tax=Pseudobdellovibrio exovorus JSS TaxID=1184267 RepID=M4VBB7_9BACT|nr:NADAR family protein [Pseudobdellovibrio exovorus]AGH95780.1 hypothetical protein A11Q_1564 [Pseudobdellovibrio exovorus JSS]
MKTRSPKQILLILSILLAGCVSGGHSQIKDGYPDVWWQAVPEAELPSWEIPPQAADRSKGEVILSKRNELGQFSNLPASEFSLDGLKYASVEGLWQSLKYPESATDERARKDLVWPYTRAEVRALSGFEAKKAGDLANANMKKLGIKWVTYKGRKIEYNGRDQEVHYELILNACRAKLRDNPELVRLLLSTGDLTFLADHRQKADSPPAYFYHEIYMRLRAELRHEGAPR